MSFEAALTEWSRILPADRIAASGEGLRPYSEGTTLTGTAPLAVLFPISTEEVSAIARVANQHRVPLHAISRGCNWGYGDASAPGNGQVIVDLRRMSRILEVNTQMGYAVIEPGVSQGQLWKRLQGTGLWMDATGAGPESSLVGNTADRGFGHTRYGDHFQTACGLEVVLADGRVLRTGFSHYEGARAKWVYKYGVGPMLDGLFSQSNFGIITRMGIWLMPEPEAFCAYFFRVPEDSDLERVIDELAPLKQNGLIQSAVHLANDLRALSGRIGYPWERAGGETPLPEKLRAELRTEFKLGAWNGCGAITGAREVVAATRKRLKRALRGYKPIFLDDAGLARASAAVGFLNRFGIARGLGNQLEVVRPIFGMLKGEPVSEPLTGASWRVRGRESLSETDLLDPVKSGAGLIWVSPVLPMTGQDARELMNILSPIYAKYGFETLVTFTLLTERALCCVTNISFDRSEAAECTRARACYAELIAEMRREGFITYRTGPMGFSKLADGSSVFWDVVGELKGALDPAGILSPGRYSPR